MATKKSATKKAAVKSEKAPRATKEKLASKSAKASPAKAATKKRMGRPRKPATERKAVALSLRVTAGEKAALEAAAKRHGMSITALILAAVDAFDVETR